MIDLLQFRKNVHSQNGEDGIIEKILLEARIESGYFVEFGAWDGVFCSNSCHLAERGWGGVFIEGDTQRFGDLRRNHGSRDLELVNTLVAASGENSLANIIGRTRYAGVDPILLSIDIDSDDLATWQGFQGYRPVIVVIEFNATIPADVSFKNPVGQQAGNSALAIYEHATENDYAFVAQTDTNLIFVDRKRLPASIVELNFLNTQRKNADRYFFGYDGTLYRYVAQNDRIDVRVDEVFQTPWANALAAQPVPRFFRYRFRGSRMVYALMFVWNVLVIAITRPISFVTTAVRNRSKLLRYLGSLTNRASQAEKLG